MTATPTQKRSLAPITYLRVLAATAVLTFHAYQHSGMTGMDGWPFASGLERGLVTLGAGGVDAFFVITAFLVSRAVVRGFLGEGEPARGGALLSKRVVSLVPAYLVAVLVVWAISNPRLPGHWQDLLLHLTFTQVYSDDYIFWTLGPAWFVAVAIHFYVLIALACGPLQRWTRSLPERAQRVRVVLGLAGLLVAVSWGYRLVMHYGLDRPEESWSTWFGPLSRLDLLGLGVGLALLSVLRVRIPRWAGAVSRLAAGALFVGTAVAYPLGQADWWPHGLFGLATVLLLVPSVCAAPGARQHTPPAWTATVALLSYGIYIWQEPVLRLLDWAGLLPADDAAAVFPVTAALLMAATLVAAYLSHHLLETPFRSLASWRSRAVTPSAGAHRPADELVDAGR